MSHEIRSPMSGLLGVLELLRNTELDAQQAHMAQMVHNAAASLLAVLNDILDFSKIEAGAMLMTPEPTRLRDLLTDVVQPYAVIAAGKGIELGFDLGADVPNCAMIDPLRVRQILNNLLSNATKFTSGGTIHLHVDMTPGDPAPILYFAVSDAGIGMADDVLERLFEPFMQADSSTSRHFGGTGLGLSIARRMAHLLGGGLGVASQAGKGSVVTLWLPLVAAADPEPVTVPAPAAPESWTGQGRALVADDDPTNRWLMQRQLERLGLSVEVAEDGLSALAKLQAARYDVLVTDCHMPRMDGAALTRAIRQSADPVLRALPVIGVTADVTPNQRARCDAAGMTELAIKPLTLRDLARLVSRQLGAAGVAELAVQLVTQRSAVAPATFDSSIYHVLFPSGDPEGESWLAEYVDAAAGMDRKIEHLLEQATDGAMDRIGLAGIAHRLAGSALSVGAAALGEQAGILEQQAETADLAVLRQAHTALQNELAAVHQAIAVFTSGTPTELVA